MDIVTTHHLKKYFGEGERQIRALDGIDLAVEKGKFTAVIGPSGAGKSTLFHLIAGLDEPTEGTVIVDGTEISGMTEEQLTIFRRRKIGFVFQDCALVPELTVRENILFPMALDHMRPDWPYFSEITGLLGLSEKLDSYPKTLSGGAAQCTAIARALIMRPSIVLADEPTGSLDAKTGQNVAGLLKMTAETFHQSLLMITHNLELAQLADRVVHLRDGHIDG